MNYLCTTNWLAAVTENSKGTNSIDSSELATIANATGVPATFKKRAQNWLVRFIGGTVAAPLVKAGRESWDIVEGRSKVSQMLAEEVGRQAIADPELVERAKAHFLSDIFRKQENREAVAAEAHEQLAASPEKTEATEEDVDEDWMNVFSRYAEAASSQRVRAIWGKILAGEIRKSGSFSALTMRILSEMDQDIAQEFEFFAQYVFGGYAVKQKSWNRGRFFDLGCKLETAGLVTGGSGAVNRIIQAKTEAVLTLASYGDYLFLAKMDEGAQYPVLALTNSGKQLLNLTNWDPYRSSNEMAVALKEHGAHSAALAAVDNQKSVRVLKQYY
jgi:hypothetical protein